MQFSKYERSCSTLPYCLLCVMSLLMHLVLMTDSTAQTGGIISPGSAERPVQFHRVTPVSGLGTQSGPASPKRPTP